MSVATREVSLRPASAWLGEVPAHWTIQPAISLAEVRTSSVDKKEYEGEQSVRLCNYTDVYYGDRIVDPKQLMRATASADQIRRFTPRRGDVPITKDSETADDIGISAFIEQDMPGVVYGYHLAIYRPPDYWTGRFIKYLFDSTYIKAVLETQTLGVTRVGLSQNTLHYMKWPVPPLSERRQIAEFLDYETGEIDAFIADQKRLIELLTERRAAAWSGQVRALADHNPVVELRRAIDSIVDGPFGSSLTSAHYSDSGTRVIRLGNIGLNSFLTEDEAFIPESYAAQLSSHSAREGDLVIAGLGDAGHPLGRAAVIPPSIPRAIVKADCYRVRPGHAVTAEYLAWTLSSGYCSEQFGFMSRGSTRQRLNTSIVRNVRIPLPSLEEQHEAVSNSNEADEAVSAAIADAREAIALSKERRAALISAAVTGTIDVRDWERPKAG